MESLNQAKAREPQSLGTQRPQPHSGVSGLGPSPQLSLDRLFDRRPLAEFVKKHRSNAPSDRCRSLERRIDVTSDRTIVDRARIGRSSDRTRTGRPTLRIRTGIQRRPGDRRSHAPVLPTEPAAGVGATPYPGWPRPPPCAHTSSGGRNFQEPKTPYAHRFNHTIITTLETYSSRHPSTGAAANAFSTDQLIDYRLIEAQKTAELWGRATIWPID